MRLHIIKVENKFIPIILSKYEYKFYILNMLLIDSEISLDLFDLKNKTK